VTGKKVGARGPHRPNKKKKKKTEKKQISFNIGSEFPSVCSKEIERHNNPLKKPQVSL